MQELQQDLSGMTFGFLTVKEKIIGKLGGIKWKCQCKCGAIKIKHPMHLLKSKEPKCCSTCSAIEDKIHINDVFGCLLVLKKLNPSEKRLTYMKYECICINCGTQSIRSGFIILKKISHKHCANPKCVGQFILDNPRPSVFRKNYGESNFNNQYRNYQYAAKRRNIQFNLSEQDCEFLFSQRCHYCNAEPQIKKKKGSYGDYASNGIDRIDSSKDYTLDNCVTACGNCNRAKLDLSYENFLNLIRSIYNHRCKIEDINSR